MHDREPFPFIMAALAGVMANPNHAHRGAKPDELADLAIAAARTMAAKLGQVEEVRPQLDEIELAGVEIGEIKARLAQLEAKVLQPDAAALPPTEHGT